MASKRPITFVKRPERLINRPDLYMSYLQWEDDVLYVGMGYEIKLVKFTVYDNVKQRKDVG